MDFFVELSVYYQKLLDVKLSSQVDFFIKSEVSELVAFNNFWIVATLWQFFLFVESIPNVFCGEVHSLLISMVVLAGAGMIKVEDDDWDAVRIEFA